MATKGTGDFRIEGCSSMDFEDSSSSCDSFMYKSPPLLQPSTTDENDSNEGGAAVKGTASALVETPRIKSNGFLHQPVRRRLLFPSDDDDEENSTESWKSKNSDATNVDKRRIENPGLPHDSSRVSKSQQKVLGQIQNPSGTANEVVPKPQLAAPEKQPQQGGSRRIAQLVVWTKNLPRKDLKEDKEVVATRISSSTETDLLKNPEGNLFFVQCPIRPLTEASKKPKAPKRLKQSPSNPKKKSALNKSSAQASSSGRAYRAYLHTCLEKQRQQLRSGPDFKVEKLFQPEQGVALPGEIPPPIETTSCIAAELNTNSVPATNCNVTGNNSCVIPLSLSSETDPPVPSQSCDKVVATTSNAGAGGEFTIFDLPDRFTVTTDATNEFDLLIQNVVHEEMVDGENGDDLMRYGFDQLRKKMRMSEGTASNEDRMSMDEAGKPRCTYTELIEKALTESGGLTVSEIYNWISERYPFFKPDDDRWKNSVRHNLSINPYFKKGEKAKSGAGHLWTISEESKGLRPSMVSWDDERRKSPSDFSDFIMPMESETDRAVANILGQYLSECRASKQSTEKGKADNNSGFSSNETEQKNSCHADITHSTVNPEPTDAALSHEQIQAQIAQIASDTGVPCDLAPEISSVNLNELNAGQFTVDLAGITIPDGGTINFEELVNAGRLIYITTDPEANKENDSTQAVILNECLLPDLSSMTSNTSNSTDDGNRFNSFYSDQLIDLGFGKGDSMPGVSFASDVSQLSYPTTFTTGSVVGCQDIMASGQLVPQNEAPPCEAQHHHQELTELDQVIPMSYDSMTSASNGSGISENLPPDNVAALYESKELGISYTYQTEPNNHDLL